MIVRTPKDLGQLIRARRRELGLDQRTLAARVGVSRLWVIEFEQGKPRAEIGLVLRTLLALDLHLDVRVEADQATRSTPVRPAATRASAARPRAIDIDAIVDAARKKTR
ncbi:MAG: helix-turn-helix transcriptional regulator [Labilithrix sp.]|nr:helix-turn-helix transcriptional regulator [Labilithrix sp.]